MFLVPITYNIPTTPIHYAVQVHFDGYIPILGGTQGTVDLNVGISVTGLAPEADGNPRNRTDLDDLKIMLNGATLPFGKDEVMKYFPNTVSMTPQGKVLKNDAPDLNLPVQLPGLDIKRFPDITFLPIEFPTTDVEQGKPFTYSRLFGMSEVQYTVTPVEVSPDTLVLHLQMIQDYENVEDDAHNPTKNPKDAVASVKTHVAGDGKVVFDRKRGLVTSSHIEADAKSTVADIASKAVSNRELKTSQDVKLK